MNEPEENQKEKKALVLLHEEPGELLRLRLTNRSSDRAAMYKVKTTAPKRYRVNPNAAQIEPGATVEVKGALANPTPPPAPALTLTPRPRRQCCCWPWSSTRTRPSAGTAS